MADEPIRDEAVVIGIDPQAVDGLDASAFHGSDTRVVEPSVTQLTCDGSNVGIGDVRQNFGAVLPPARKPIDVVLAQPLLVSPTSTTVSTNECSEARNMVTVQTSGVSREGCEQAVELGLLSTAEPNLGGQRARLVHW